jgi:hypothetical protein
MPTAVATISSISEKPRTATAQTIDSFVQHDG